MYQSHIYLEIRTIVSTKKKVFQKKDNQISVDEDAVNKVVRIAKALGCKFLEKPFFEKQNGLQQVPDGIEFSDFSLKLAENGCVETEFHRRKKNIKIESIRLEEDCGRLTHSNGVARMDYTWCGYASMRIKTYADFELGDEAMIFLNDFRRLVQYLDINSQIPIENAIRCNAYVSLARYPEMPAYYVKLRNLNSFNFVKKAINLELSRQEEILFSGKTVKSESRLWNEKQNLTEFFKSHDKDDISQFEQFNPPISFNLVDFLKEHDAYDGEELPLARKKRIVKLYGLSNEKADFICDEKNRADFFEESVSFGAEPVNAAHWISSEVMKLLKRNNLAIKNDFLTSENFAKIMKLLTTNKIHSVIVKQLLQGVIETGKDPGVLLKENNWKKITDVKYLTQIVQDVIEKNPQQSEKLRSGEMAPLEFLTGLVMKQTGNLADPLLVKSLLKKQLKISIVYVLSMGGSICGCMQKDGTVTPSDEKNLLGLFQQASPDVRFQIIPVSHMLSEEIEPADWALLIEKISSCIASGNATGLIITHGTDTLAYTSALLYWLFSDSNVPIIITASSKTPDTSSEAENNVKLSVNTVFKEKKGVYVVFNQKLYSPLNLKFEKPTSDGFANWNMEKPSFIDEGPLPKIFNTIEDIDPFVMKQLLREAADRLFVCRIYPGLKAEHFISLIDEGVSYFFLELYETGTGSMKNNAYSLKPLLINGKKRGCHFYCTSQQHSEIDFSGFTTSHRVWREGAVPMGRLTTESAVALYFAASIVCDSTEEIDSIMETYSDLFQ